MYSLCYGWTLCHVCRCNSLGADGAACIWCWRWKTWISALCTTGITSENGGCERDSCWWLCCLDERFLCCKTALKSEKLNYAFIRYYYLHFTRWQIVKKNMKSSKYFWNSDGKSLLFRWLSFSFRNTIFRNHILLFLYTFALTKFTYICSYMDGL